MIKSIEEGAWFHKGITQSYAMEFLMLNLLDTEENHHPLLRASSGFLPVFWLKSKPWNLVFSSYLFFSFAQLLLKENKIEELNMVLQFKNKSSFLTVALKASCLEVLSATWTQQVVNKLSMSEPSLHRNPNLSFWYEYCHQWKTLYFLVIYDKMCLSTIGEWGTVRNLSWNKRAAV